MQVTGSRLGQVSMAAACQRTGQRRQCRDAPVRKTPADSGPAGVEAGRGNEQRPSFRRLAARVTRAASVVVVSACLHARVGASSTTHSDWMVATRGLYSSVIESWEL